MNMAIRVQLESFIDTQKFAVMRNMRKVGREERESGDRRLKWLFVWHGGSVYANVYNVSYKYCWSCMCM